ncbi:MAG: 1,4-alpha-glucan branching protein domain-containing protein [Candidatus Helarchaeota archaeon]
MSSNVKGYFSFVLHSHLPYVIAHGTWPHGMDWLNEATAECYIPILNTLYKLKEEGFTPRLTINLSPILCEQLKNEMFIDSFISYLENKISFAEADKKIFIEWKSENLIKLSDMWKKFYTDIIIDFKEKYNKDLVNAFKVLQDENIIEIITCAATHGYLPLLSQDYSISNQVKVGVECYKKHFKRDPIGIWLPECAYRPAYKWKNPIFRDEPEYERKGIEEILDEHNLKYFIIDTHLLMGGEAIGVYAARFEALKMLWENFKRQYKPPPIDFNKSPYKPYLVSSTSNFEAQVAVFVRDPRTSIQLWSAEHGYPGDGWYLEFHKKHFPSGHRYWRITSSKTDLGDKLEYVPENVESRLEENAGHYKDLIKELVLEFYSKNNQEAGIVVAPYDTELLGHWWFEGPQFLYKVLKWVEMDPEIELTTCGKYLKAFPPVNIIHIPEGSWGEGQGHWIWLNEWTTWTWEKIYKTEKRLKGIFEKYSDANDKNIKRILIQLEIENLLLQSSDWQFLISTWSARDYAENRVAEHYNRIKKLISILESYETNKTLPQEHQTYLDLLWTNDKIFKEEIETALNLK